jgi:hypothetical protein
VLSTVRVGDGLLLREPSAGAGVRPTSALVPGSALLAVRVGFGSQAVFLTDNRVAPSTPSRVMMAPAPTSANARGPEADTCGVPIGEKAYQNYDEHL